MVTLLKYCIEWKADMLKNLFKATKINPYSHDCISNVQCNLQIGLLTRHEGRKVLLEKLLQHISLPQTHVLQLVSLCY
jgi:hypothetical protein